MLRWQELIWFNQQDNRAHMRYWYFIFTSKTKYLLDLERKLKLSTEIHVKVNKNPWVVNGKLENLMEGPMYYFSPT